MTQLLCFQNVATKLVNPKQIGRETIEFSWPGFSPWPFFSFLPLKKKLFLMRLLVKGTNCLPVFER